MKKVIVGAVIVVGGAGAVWLKDSASTPAVSASVVESSAQAPSGALPAVEQMPQTSVEASGTARKPTAPVEVPAASPVADETLTPDEQSLVAMYEQISRAIAEEGKPCEALGGEFTDAVNRFAPQVQAWSRSQQGKDEATLALDQARLQRLTGDRLKHAQEAIQGAMVRCAQNTAFQTALQGLAAASAP